MGEDEEQEEDRGKRTREKRRKKKLDGFLGRIDRIWLRHTEFVVPREEGVCTPGEMQGRFWGDLEGGNERAMGLFYEMIMAAVSGGKVANLVYVPNGDGEIDTESHITKPDVISEDGLHEAKAFSIFAGSCNLFDRQVGRYRDLERRTCVDVQFAFFRHNFENIHRFNGTKEQLFRALAQGTFASVWLPLDLIRRLHCSRELYDAKIVGRYPDLEKGLYDSLRIYFSDVNGKERRKRIEDILTRIKDYYKNIQVVVGADDEAHYTSRIFPELYSFLKEFEENPEVLGRYFKKGDLREDNLYGSREVVENSGGLREDDLLSLWRIVGDKNLLNPKYEPSTRLYSETADGFIFEPEETLGRCGLNLNKYEIKRCWSPARLTIDGVGVRQFPITIISDRNFFEGSYGVEQEEIPF